MQSWDAVDWILLVVAGYIAVGGLVRLMLARRNQLIDELGAQLEQRGANVSQAEPGKNDNIAA